MKFRVLIFVSDGEGEARGRAMRCHCGSEDRGWWSRPCFPKTSSLIEEGFDKITPSRPLHIIPSPPYRGCFFVLQNSISENKFSYKKEIIIGGNICGTEIMGTSGQVPTFSRTICLSRREFVLRIRRDPPRHHYIGGCSSSLGCQI